MRITFVIAAAGKGTRLGSDKPKVLTQIGDRVVLRYITDKIYRVKNELDANTIVDSIVVTGIPIDYSLIENSVFPDSPGMAATVMSAYSHFCLSDRVVVMWGDALGITSKQMLEAVRLSIRFTMDTVVVPMAFTGNPYTCWSGLNGMKRLNIRESREGDEQFNFGWADCGFFVISNPALMYETWLNYKQNCIGAKTGEYNFLPLIRTMVNVKNYRLHKLTIPISSTKGLNTPEDLEYWVQNKDKLAL